MNTQRNYTPKSLIENFHNPISSSSANFFFSFLKDGEKKRVKKRSFCLQYKITNCPNNRSMSQDICTLFMRHLHSTLYGHG